MVSKPLEVRGGNVGNMPLANQVFSSVISLSPEVGELQVPRGTEPRVLEQTPRQTSRLEWF